jgi:hypothetical protein
MSPSWLKLNGTHRLLIFADHTNLLAENNIRWRQDASIEADQTNYTLVIILCSLIFTNCIVSLHNIFYYSIFTACFDPMWSSSGITYSHNHLGIIFYFPYSGQCLHVGKMLTYICPLSKFVLYIIKLIYIYISLIQIFSSTPSVYVPPLMSETKFQTHIEPQAKL